MRSGAEIDVSEIRICGPFEPPYYAVVFAATLGDIDLNEYRSRSAGLSERVKRIPGFLGEDALSSPDGRLLSITYWRSENDWKEWAADPVHREAKHLGRTKYFSEYQIHIAKVEPCRSSSKPPRAQHKGQT